MGTCESCLKPEHETTTNLHGAPGSQPGSYAQQGGSKTISNHAVVTEESDEDEEMEDLTKEQLQKKKERGHATISAEAYGKHNQKGDFKPKVIPKSSEQRDRIIARLAKAFMFQALDDKEREIVINAMEEKRLVAGEFAIKQGDNGDVLYVVDEGKLDCTKRFKKDDPTETYLKTYEPGESFGELALLYNAPRAASIKANTDSILWALDRETFNAIVKDSAMKKRQNYEQFLKGIKILESMDDYERSKVADCLKTIKFKAGDYIIRQGDKGDTFYFIEQGKAAATKRNEQGIEEEVYQYDQGQYFGELSLLKDQPRAANIIARTDVTLASIDRGGFKRVLGNLEDIMKRNTQNYKGYNF